MNEVNRTYSTSNQEQREYPVRLFSDDDDFDYPPQDRNYTVDPRYVLRRVDVRNNIDYSMCVDTDDEKTC